MIIDQLNERASNNKAQVYIQKTGQMKLDIKENGKVNDDKNVDKRVQQKLKKKQTKLKLTSYQRSIHQINQFIQSQLYNKYLDKRIHFFKILFKDFSPYVFQDKNNKNASALNQVTLGVDFFNSEWLQDIEKFGDQFASQVKNLINTNIIIHARLSYILYILGFGISQIFQKHSIALAEQLKPLKQYFIKNRIRYSFDQKLWQKGFKSQLEYQYSYKNKSKKQQQNQNQWIQQQAQMKFPLLKTIHKFYKILNFDNENHPFNKRMKNLTNQDNKIRYIEELSFYSFIDKKDILNIYKKQGSQSFNNIYFYHNMLKASYDRLTLNQMHNEKDGDYEWLESTHDYIQWMFPNHFKSNFNSNSYPMGYVEAQVFRTSKLFGVSVKRSFQIYLDFIGCRLMNNNGLISVQRGLRKAQIHRLNDALIRYTHNHLRISRIISCLSVVGLRVYAQAFLLFLQDLTLSNEYRKESIISQAFDNYWKLYGSELQSKKKKALQMCFIPEEDFPEHKYLDEIVNQVKRQQNTYGMTMKKWIEKEKKDNKINYININDNKAIDDNENDQNKTIDIQTIDKKTIDKEIEQVTQQKQQFSKSQTKQQQAKQQAKQQVKEQAKEYAKEQVKEQAKQQTEQQVKQQVKQQAKIQLFSKQLDIDSPVLVQNLAYFIKEYFKHDLV